MLCYTLLLGAWLNEALLWVLCRPFGWQDNNKALEGSRAEVAEKEKTFNHLTQQYNEMCAGIAGAEGGDATLTEQIASTGQQAQAAKAEKKQCTSQSFTAVAPWDGLLGHLS